jgi:poly-gamma-glutamate synthesis protein (capsule biosynthesis protein)
MYDLGDLIDDYARDERLRNDLGLLFLAEIGTECETTVSALPLCLDYAHTGPARGGQRTWIKNRLTAACAEWNTEVTERDHLLTMRTRDHPA